MISRRSFGSERSENQARCRPWELCPKCSLFAVVRFRFRAFREQFGRDPGANEPLFFDPDCDQPVQVEVAQVIEQIEAAAQALEIKATPILNFLNLNSSPGDRRAPVPDKTAQRHVSMQIAANPANPGRSQGRELFVVANRRTSGPSKRELQSTTISAWQRFVKHERAHGRHHITGEEWAMLSKVAMMGEALNSRDFIFILNTIRQAKRA